jgi:hypothetical protein
MVKQILLVMEQPSLQFERATLVLGDSFLHVKRSVLVLEHSLLEV